jgi:hypothetical protein
VLGVDLGWLGDVDPQFGPKSVSSDPNGSKVFDCVLASSAYRGKPVPLSRRQPQETVETVGEPEMGLVDPLLKQGVN